MRKKDLSESCSRAIAARARPDGAVPRSAEEFGFRYATIGGVSIGCRPRDPGEKSPLFAHAEARVERFQRAYSTGQITFGERYNKVIDAWTHA